MTEPNRQSDVWKWICSFLIGVALMCAKDYLAAMRSTPTREEVNAQVISINDKLASISLDLTTLKIQQQVIVQRLNDADDKGKR